MIMEVLRTPAASFLSLSLSFVSIWVVIISITLQYLTLNHNSNPIGDPIIVCYDTLNIIDSHDLSSFFASKLEQMAWEHRSQQQF